MHIGSVVQQSTQFLRFEEELVADFLDKLVNGTDVVECELHRIVLPASEQPDEVKIGVTVGDVVLTDSHRLVLQRVGSFPESFLRLKDLIFAQCVEHLFEGCSRRHHYSNLTVLNIL